MFFFEYVDEDGERVLQHTQFEAMADFVLIEEGTKQISLWTVFRR